MKTKIALLLVGMCAVQLTATRGYGADPLPAFTPLPYEPEGVAVDKVGNVYVSMKAITSDQVWKVTPAGEMSLYADFGAPSGGACGLAVDAEGNVYMARTLAAAPKQGVYKVDRAGNVSFLSGTENIVFPDGLAFDQRGNLYITEMFSLTPTGFGQGGIWRVPKGGGPAELWLRDELLTGVAPTLFPFPLGANGICFCLGSLYVVNTDKALVLRIPVLPEGSAGPIEVWKQVADVPESIFYQSPYFPLMLDGLSMDVHGNVYVVSPSRLAVIRVNAADQSQETIAVFPQSPLDAPLSLAFGTGAGARQSLYVTASGILGNMLPGPWPGPGLVKVQAGIPGLPLP